jgi:transglutaminase-like putative cysteine protease
MSRALSRKRKDKSLPRGEIVVRRLRPVILVAVIALLAPSALAAPPKSRTFLFTYAATVTDLEPGKTVRLWLPVPPTNDEQTATVVRRQLPGEAKTGKDTTFGNSILYVEGKAGADGTVPLSVTYRVTRREVIGDALKRSGGKEETELYLKPNALVPVTGKPLTLLDGMKLPADHLELARTLYEVVRKHMRYSKEGTGWVRGDAVWACENKFGNCSDFHSLFLSLARANGIPARFEIGFPLPDKHGSGEVKGYHCWAWFWTAGKGWLPVDISEASKEPVLANYYFGNLTENRVLFSTGRDLTLTPKQDGPPLNFFVYPYAEVDGKPYPAAKIECKPRYEDLTEDK